MARPTKLAPKVERRICDLLRRHVPRERAARLAGLSPTTFHRWMQEGEQGKDRRKREFREAVLRAEDEAIERALRGSVEDAFASTCPDCGTPREDAPCPGCGSTKPARYVHELRERVAAARFILPHRYPREFSTRAEVQTTGPGGGPVQVQAEVAVRPLFSDEQLAAMSPEQLAAALAGMVGR